MKNLLTKTLFVLLFFPFIAPSIQADDAPKSDTPPVSVEVEAPVIQADDAPKSDTPAVSDGQTVSETPPVSVEVEAPVIQTDGAPESDTSPALVETTEVDTNNGAEQRAEPSVAKGGNFLGNWRTEYKTGLRYSAYAAAIAAASYGLYKAYNSEKFKNEVTRLYKKYGKSVFVGVATTALYALAVCKGYALSPSEMKNAFSRSFRLGS